MAQILVRDLVAVSNNSPLTNMVANTLNTKLDDKEKNELLQWLQIVKNEIRTAESRSSKPWRMR